MKSITERVAPVLPERQAQKIIGMDRYIERTKKISMFRDCSPYQITISEMNALIEASGVSICDALWFSFVYGRARGYREGRSASQNTKKVRKGGL